MKTVAGLWIDHRQAVIVKLLDQGEEIKRMSSNVGKHVRYSGSSHATPSTGASEDAAEDTRDRRFDDLLGKYYDRVISGVRDAESILIFGPGEAKTELHKRFEAQGLGEHVVGVESADKMTDGQIVAAVRQHFGD